MTRLARTLACAVALLATASLHAEGQRASDQGDLFSATTWCADSGTACWTRGSKREFVNGVRILAELDLSFLIQRGQNRFEGSLSTFPKIALEWNLLGGWIALQTAILAPGSVRVDRRSPVALLLADTTAPGRLDFDWGWSIGLSFLDGSLAAGYGRLNYDRRQFRSTVQPSGTDLREGFRYIALQPISAIRSKIKGTPADATASPATVR